MSSFVIWTDLFLASILLGSCHYGADYNKDLANQNSYYKFLEFLRFGINYFLALAIVYYFVSVRWSHISSGGNFSKGDFILAIISIVGIFGWLPYFIKNITEGITVIFQKILGK